MIFISSPIWLTCLPLFFWQALNKVWKICSRKLRPGVWSSVECRTFCHELESPYRLMRFTLFSVGRVPSLSDVSELASRLGFHGGKDEFRKASWEYCEEMLIGRGSAFKQSPSIFLVICDLTVITIHTHHINCCNGQLHQHCTADRVPHCAGLKERE